MQTQLMEWLLVSDEPWTQYRTFVDLLERPEADPEVRTARAEMLAHPQIKALMQQVTAWPGYALKRHNDAQHPLYALSTLADFGLKYSDPGMPPAIDTVLAHRSAEGLFQTMIMIPKAFGGTDEEMWTWVLCDAPTLLYALQAMGLGANERVEKGMGTLIDLVDDNGWRCKSASEFGGKFRGPGRREDPCPIANVYVLKALSQRADLLDSPAAHHGVEMLLGHWEKRGERKYYLFGIGTDFRRLKYPFVWYDILHVVEVLSRYPFVHSDKRFREMIDAITSQADGEGRYSAGSMYRAWKDWSFADKKNTSPWLTFLVLRILKRVEMIS
jgi:hypothetical protein